MHIDDETAEVVLLALYNCKRCKRGLNVCKCGTGQAVRDHFAEKRNERGQEADRG